MPFPDMRLPLLLLKSKGNRMIYNILVILVIVFSLQLAGIIKSREYNLRFFYGRFLAYFKTDIKKIKGLKKEKVSDIFDLLRTLSFYSSFLLFLIMAASGFLPFVFLGTSLTGFALLIHVTAAPLFCISYAVFILLSAFQYQFGNTEYLFVFKRDTVDDLEEYEYAKDSLVLKSAFWISAVISVPVIISIILTLFPIFGSDAMVGLTTIHGYSVLILTISFVIQVYYSIILRSKDKLKI
jgi:hypothetical protein